MFNSFFNKLSPRAAVFALKTRVAECEGDINDERPACKEALEDTAYKVVENTAYNLALEKLKRKKTKLRRDWDHLAKHAQPIPSRTWPERQPDDEEIPSIDIEWTYCQRESQLLSIQGGEFIAVSAYCNDLLFALATSLLGQSLEEKLQKRGGLIIRVLAHQGYPDAMCSYGMCLMEGKGCLPTNSDEGVMWLRKASDEHNHAQATYELAGAFYLGDGVEVDECKSVHYFKKAATIGHVAAAYMLGDCLLDGIGVKINRAEGIFWLFKAAEDGHRGARSRILSLIEYKDGNNYGGFTDSSRQSLLSLNTSEVQNYGGIINSSPYETTQIVSPIVRRRNTLNNSKI